MSVRWTHITITVGDINRSIDFYTSVCGLAVVRDRRRDGGGTVWLGYEPPAGEDPAFVLVIMEGEVTDRLDHFGFQCESREEVDAVAEDARRRGILVHPPQDSGGAVGYWTIIRDPDGHQVEFTFGQPLRGLS
ncbi:MAG TPA: VOC family protein [Pyrinomonadaceae bacterium]|nr:VOC family protein [Pyrinomonadaceae bacterium]